LIDSIHGLSTTENVVAATWLSTWHYWSMDNIWLPPMPIMLPPRNISSLWYNMLSDTKTTNRHTISDAQLNNIQIYTHNIMT